MPRMTTLSKAVITGLAICARADAALAAPARRHHRQREDSEHGYGAVTAHSRYGNPTRSAAVRRGQFGPEIDIGSNTWIHCAAGDCSETLRREKIDFWETKREEGGGGGRH